MTEKIVTETYSRETRRRHYDQRLSERNVLECSHSNIRETSTGRYIDDAINAGKQRLLAPVPTNNKPERHYSTVTNPDRSVPDRSYVYYSVPPSSQSTPVPPRQQTSSDGEQIRQLTEVVSTLVRDSKKDKYKEHKKSTNQAQSFRPSVSADELSELKTAIAYLTKRFDDSDEKNRTEQEEKDAVKRVTKLRKAKEMVDIQETQKLIQDQLDDQRDMLRKIDQARHEADSLLRFDITEAFTEHKRFTDGAVQELAAKVSDLVADTSRLQSMVEDLNKTIDSLYIEEVEEEVKPHFDGKPHHHAREDLSQVRKPNTGFDSLLVDDKAHHRAVLQERASPIFCPGVYEVDNPEIIVSKGSSRRSSMDSGSIAIELPPAILTDGRRPSQALHIHTLKRTQEAAELEAMKILEDATRISSVRL